MGEDWRNTFEIVTPGGGGGGGQGQEGVAPKGPKSILYKHSHVAYQIKGNGE